MSVKEISREDWHRISGANGHSNYEGGSSRGNNSSRNVASSASNITYSYTPHLSDACIENTIGGAFLGMAGGTPATVAVGAIGGSIIGGCWRPDSNGGGRSSNAASNCAGGSECSR